jgi:hypothetical protein
MAASFGLLHGLGFPGVLAAFWTFERLTQL